MVLTKAIQALQITLMNFRSGNRKILALGLDHGQLLGFLSRHCSQERGTIGFSNFGCDRILRKALAESEAIARLTYLRVEFASARDQHEHWRLIFEGAMNALELALMNKQGNGRVDERSTYGL